MLTAVRNEPFTDFSKEENRALYRAGLEKVRSRLGETYPLRIGGSPVLTDKRITSLNPGNPSEVVGSLASAGVAEADRAIAAALEAFKEWAAWSPEARARVIVKAAAIMRRRKYEFSALMTLEVGKAWAEADADTAEAIDFLEYYARHALRLAGPQPMTPWPGEENHLYYTPMGVGVVHSPFNFPCAIMAGMTAAAIVMGNTVVLKPSVLTPVIAAWYVEVLTEAGLPPGVVNFLPGDPTEIGDYLSADPRVHFVNFTGSATVGKHIYEVAAKTPPGQRWLKRVVAEMGGKDAIIVDETADLDDAAAGIVASAFGFNGQKCSACSRAIIVESAYDALLAKVVERTKALKIGPATEPDSMVTPLCSEAAVAKVLKYVEIGRDEGRLMTGGTRPAGLTGYYVEPAVIADVAPKARVACEEIFGPVLAVIKARDFDHALAIANDTDYGLTGGVYSRDRQRLEKARFGFHVGNLYLNRKCTGALVGVQPFGGFNLSGTDSKAGGPDYLLLFAQAKSVAERF